MIKTNRFLTAYLLALTLLLTGQAQVVARGALGPMNRMVLCTSQGALTVVMDQDGSPETARLACPDCAFMALVGVLPQTTGVARPESRSCATASMPALCIGAKRIIETKARAPPVSA